MATYAELQRGVKEQKGFVPKSCWIAHCKDLNGLNPKVSHRRRGEGRLVPCPAVKRPAIEAAFRHFGLLR